MPRKVEKAEVQAVNVFTCCDREFTPQKAIEHLAEKHGIVQGTPGTCSMIRHIDGAEFYSSIYEWAFGSVVLTQSVTQPRAKDDPMRFYE